MFFNCSSRYLFAIGLATVFSLRWSLPPASGCNPKQPDSKNHHHRRSSTRGYDQEAFHLLWANHNQEESRSPTGRLLKAVPNATTSSCRRGQRNSAMGFSRFTRRYFGNHSYFLFLRLVICLNSAGSPVRLRSCQRYKYSATAVAYFVNET